MRILLSNDDGYLAPGINLLAQSLAAIAEVIVVAPDRDRSGASNSLTLKQPLRVSQADNGFYIVEGTPTDCVHLAITGLMDQEPDMVISGINSGANLGDDILYSGTVAAATEGRFLGLPAIAVSLAGSRCKHYESAVAIILEMLERLNNEPLPPVILNVNVPDLPRDQIAGMRATRLGHRHKSEPVVRSTDPQGTEIFWVGPAGAEQDAGEGTDFHAIRQGYVSVTPLQVDLTRHHQIETIASWLTDT